VVTWNNVGLDRTRFWTAQVIIEDLDSLGAVKSSTPVDFLLTIVAATNNPPVCMVNPPGPFTVTAGNLVTFAVTGTDPDSTDQVTLNTGGLPNGATMTPTLPVSSTFNWVPTGNQGGSFPIIFSATDSGGLQALTTVNITVRPVSDLAISKRGTPAVLGRGQAVSFAIIVTNRGPSDASGVVVTDILPAGLTNITPVTSQGSCVLSNNTVTCTLGAIASTQSATITITATVDGTGTLTNIASVSSGSTDPVSSNNTATATVTVSNSPPVAVCRSITVSNGVGTCSAVVFPGQVDAGSFDPEGGPLTLALAPPGPYAVGSNAVILSVTDANGMSTSCSATIVVLDREAPVISCSSNISVNTASSAGMIVNYLASAFDPCGLADFTCRPPSGSLFPPGVTTVNCTASDPSRNTNSCTFTITVTLVPPPAIACPTNVIIECTGGLTIVGNYGVTAVDFEGNPLAVTCTPPPGTGFRLGVSNVTCTVTDSLGASSSCSFSVTVVDTQPPTLTCPGDKIVGAANAAGTLFNYVAGAFDPCGIADFNCAPPSGSTFPIGITTVTCIASDPARNTNSCSFNVTVTTGQCPASSNLVVSVDMGSSGNFQLPASDPDGDPLQFEITQAPAHGSVLVQVNTGAAAYTPTPGYCGPDGFKFRAFDGQCRSNEATVTIEVRCTARGLKRAVLAEIIAARATATSPTDQDRLDKAIEYLTAALGSSLWINDNHLVPKFGQTVFQKEKDAVNKLNDLIGDRRTEIPAATLQSWADRLVQADRILAVVSVDEAEAGGGNPAKIAQDREEIAKGDADAAAGREENAIEHYRNAWKHAVHLQVHSSLNIAGGQAELQFLAFPGERYVIQTSTDLVNWTTLTTVTANTSGVINYTDSSATGESRRFYRAVEP
jgi:uncharacterized repeat protein (TIGR01451 family)